VIITEMAEDKRTVDPTLASFYEAMEMTNVEKITDEMLAGLSRIPAMTIVLIWRVITKMSKIGHGFMSKMI
jgi:F420-0:gamma-glutamyl ligase-like protein